MENLYTIPEGTVLEYTNEIASVTAYLAGVKSENFSDTPGHLQKEVYDKAEKNKFAKIVRNLCVVRNALLRNYYEINERIK